MPSVDDAPGGADWTPRSEPYTPADLTAAECPSCGGVVPHIPPPQTPGLEFATYMLRCPDCGGQWSEYRGGFEGCRRLPHHPPAA
jgi:hypothetical protein